LGLDAAITYQDLCKIQGLIRLRVSRLPIGPGRKIHCHELAAHLTFLMYKQSLKSKSFSWYCTPSQRYLAAKIGYHPRTLRRDLKILREAKWISIKQRRPSDTGVLLTPLYTPGRQLAAIIMSSITTRAKNLQSTTEKT